MTEVMGMPGPSRPCFTCSCPALVLSHSSRHMPLDPPHVTRAILRLPHLDAEYMPHGVTRGTRASHTQPATLDPDDAGS